MNFSQPRLWRHIETRLADIGTRVATLLRAMIHPPNPLPRGAPRSVGTSLSLAAIALSLSASLVGCEGDSFGYSTRKLPSYNSGSAPAQQGNEPASAPTPKPSSSPGSPPGPESTPSQADAGTKPDAAPPSPSASGTCGNPKCAATGGLCGCKATDSAGNTVGMGCQSGACACFDANGNDTNDFASACSDPASAALAFQQCACN